MSLSNYKITDAAIAQKGVVAAPDKLTGTAAQNKAVFDRLIREAVKELFNGLIDALCSEDGAAEVGTAAIDGVTGGDVQTVLSSLKTLLDTKSASADMAAALALKSDRATTDLHIKSVSLNAETGVFTFTREDGSYVSVDTVLEKVATNWQYDADTQSLVLTLADGTVQRVPLSAFITETEFADSASVAFSVSGHTVSATVKAGGITDAMLSSALIAQLRGYVSDAADSAADAAQSESAAALYRTAAANSASAAASSETNAAASAQAAADSASAASGSASGAAGSASAAALSKTGADSAAILAESYARGGTGTRAGEDTDNALYYKNQAQQIVGGDYATNTDLANALSAHNTGVSAHSDIRTALAAHTGSGDIHVTAAQKTAWTNKQNALTFDAAPTSGSGNPVTSGGVYTAIQNAGKSPYVKTFAAADWSNGTLTISAAAHGFTGSGVLAQFMHLVNDSYVPGTWACVESWAEINASTHVITLHGPAAGYAGKVTIYG